MRRIWWKILCVLILLYTITAGLLIPLRPGVLDVHPQKAEGGSTVNLQVTGYNTHFDEAGAENVRAWLKMDDGIAIEATNVQITDRRNAVLSFRIPKTLPERKEDTYLALIMDNPLDGAFVLPDAIRVPPKSLNVDPAGENLWTAEITDLHELGSISFPFRSILYETIRNQYFHVPMWFAMIILLIVAVVYSIRYLRTNDDRYDLAALSFSSVAVTLGMAGITTGALWARYTWGQFWVMSDIKLNATAVALLIYLAYFVLRMSFENRDLRARISAIYGIFAFVSLIILIFVLPRVMQGSLHPGNSGNPAFSQYDLDATMRMVFYPAVIGWTLLGAWIATLRYRKELLQKRVEDY